MKEAPFVEARREIAGLTARLERRTLAWLAARVPPWMNSDHLTALGLFGMLGAGVAYRLSGLDARFTSCPSTSSWPPTCTGCSS